VRRTGTLRIRGAWDRQGQGEGRLTLEGHEGWSTVWGLGGGDKTLNTRRIQLWHCCYCDMWQMHIQWCRHQMFINHWHSVTQTVHSIFFAVRWFPQTPWPPLSPTPRLFVVCVSHTVLMQMQLWIVLQKRAFLCPLAPPYNKGSGGSRPRCPRSSGRPCPWASNHRRRAGRDRTPIWCVSASRCEGWCKCWRMLVA